MNEIEPVVQPSWPDDRSTRGIALVTGILTIVAFLFLLFHTTMTYSSQTGSGQPLAVAVVGLVASAATLVVGLVVRGLAAAIALAGLGVFLMVIPPAFLGERCPIPGPSGETGIGVFGLVLLVLMVGAMYARGLALKSHLTRWVLCAIAGVGMVLQGVSGLIVLGGNTAWAQELRQLLGSGEVLPLVTFIWMTLLVWTLLILGLVNALSEASIEKTARAGLVLAKVGMWSLVALTVIGFVLHIKRIETDVLARSIGPLTADFVASLVTGVVPLFAAAYLAAGCFASVLCSVDRALNQTEKGDKAGMGRGQLASAGVPCEAGGKSDAASILVTLADLRERGLITEEEFQARRKAVLDQLQPRGA